MRVDERGRVMLVRRALRESEGLSVYRNAWRRRGFAEKCARQLETFLQGGVTVEDLRACAEGCGGVQAAKLRDLAEVMSGYLALIAGQYQDGEMELVAAAERVHAAGFARDAHFFFYGFDIMPATLLQLIAQLSADCADAAIFYPLINDARARDADCCEVLLRQLEGLFERVRQAGGAFARIMLKPQAQTGAIAALSRELFACPPQAYAGAAGNVSMLSARDVREECMAAAARARVLAMRGMRYGDMQLICMDMDGYRQPLEEAFALYGVPLFMDRSRPASRMAPAEYLLTALKLIEKNFRTEDMFALMRTGYTALSRDEADRMMNYAVARGIEGGRWLRPLTRGGEAEIQALEPIRARLTAPIVKLKNEMRAAKALRGQLAALFRFMEETGALERSRETQQALIQRGMREQAGALAQAWNRIVGALDQMAALMGEARMGLSELSATLRESLDAAIVKQLPQSGDAVFAQDARRMLMQPARALFVLGMNDQSAPDTDGLLTDAQRASVGAAGEGVAGAGCARERAAAALLFQIRRSDGGRKAVSVLRHGGRGRRRAAPGHGHGAGCGGAAECAQGEPRAARVPADGGARCGAARRGAGAGAAGRRRGAGKAGCARSVGIARAFGAYARAAEPPGRHFQTAFGRRGEGTAQSGLGARALWAAAHAEHYAAGKVRALSVRVFY